MVCRLAASGLALAEAAVCLRGRRLHGLFKCGKAFSEEVDLNRDPGD
jgi:hypothetical protein